jgi:hypothetical protein
MNRWAYKIRLDLMRCRRQIDLRIEPHILSADELESPLFNEIKSGIRLA